MQKKITQTTGGFGLGMAPGHKLLKVPSGQYRGRAAAIVQTSSSELKIFWADRPYTSWSSATTIASDAADLPFDCRMETDGNIHVIYSETSTKYLVTRKLSFSGGSWSVGSKVTIYNSYESYYPSVDIEEGGKLWVSWSRKEGGFYYLHAKASTDGGSTWGSGPTDGGDALTGGASSVYSKLVIGTNDIYVVYTHAGSTISVRSRSVSGGSWASAVDLASSTGNFDEHFDAALSADGLLGVVFDQASLKYREYDGGTWGAVVTLDEDEVQCPQLLFNNNIPVVVYLSQVASDQYLIKQTNRKTGTFSTPAAFDARAQQFDSVLLYDTSSSSYADLTDEAAGSTTADVYHPDSGTLVKLSGDIVYLGMNRKFRYVKFLLSTAGSGGTVNYSYWDGANWKAFTPSGGNFSLDATDRDLLLWDDYTSLPEDWQKRTVNDEVRFWIKIEVDSSYSTGPVGSQLTAISDLKAVILRR